MAFFSGPTALVSTACSAAPHPASPDLLGTGQSTSFMRNTVCPGSLEVGSCPGGCKKRWSKSEEITARKMGKRICGKLVDSKEEITGVGLSLPKRRRQKLKLECPAEACINDSLSRIIWEAWVTRCPHPYLGGMKCSTAVCSALDWK